MEDQRIVVEDQRSELPQPPYLTLNGEVLPLAPRRRPRNKFRGGSCCLWVCCVLFFLPFVLLFAVYVFFSTYTPKVPTISIGDISVGTLEVNASELTIHTKMVLSLRSDNVNDRFGFTYRRYGSRVSVVYRKTTLCQGLLPSVFQAVGDTRTIDVAMEGYRTFDKALQTALGADQDAGRVPLNVYVRAPLLLRMSSVDVTEMVANVAVSTVVKNLSANATLDINNANTKYDVNVES